MDYLKIKKEIIDLKSRIVSIQLEKCEEGRNQRYEVVAELHLTMKNLMKELEEKRKVLQTELHSFQLKNSDASHYLILLACLHEITILLAPATTVEEAMQGFCSYLKEESERLMIQKRECFANHQFKQAGELNEQLFAIWRFLKFYTK